MLHIAYAVIEVGALVCDVMHVLLTFAEKIADRRAARRDA